MKMKMHKIRGIDKNICTCEQKIAYNYAFKWYPQLKNIYNSNNAQFVKCDGYQKIIDFVADSIKTNGIDKKYNIDAIIHCFRNGIKNYMEFNNSGIITNYEDIGKIFICLYEIE